MDFAENALFKSSGDICWSPLPSLLLGQLSVDKRDSDGFFSSRLACRTSDTLDRLITGYSGLSAKLRGFWLLCVCKTADHVIRHTCTRAWHVTSSCAIAQLAFLWLLYFRCPELGLHSTIAWRALARTITLLHNIVYVYMYRLDS